MCTGPNPKNALLVEKAKHFHKHTPKSCGESSQKSVRCYSHKEGWEDGKSIPMPIALEWDMQQAYAGMMFSLVANEIWPYIYILTSSIFLWMNCHVLQDEQSYVLKNAHPNWFYLLID